MKTYVIQLGFEMDFCPPLTAEQHTQLVEEYLFLPIRKLVGQELVIVEELNLIDRVVVKASDTTAKTLRQLGHHLQIKKTK
jgi:hypothetical protein